MKHFNSLNRRVLKIFPSWIRISERHLDGSWHLHLLVETPTNIRAGFDIGGFNAHRKEFNDAASFNEQLQIIHKCTGEIHPLRILLRNLKKQLDAYGFGRFDLLPVLTDAARVSNYLTKSIPRNMAAMRNAHIRLRLVSYSKSFKPNHGAAFTWVCPLTRAWRKKLALFGQQFGCDDHEKMKSKFGPKWGYKCRDLISILTLPPRNFQDLDYYLQFNVALCLSRGDLHFQGTKSTNSTQTEAYLLNRNMYNWKAWNKILFRRVSKLYPGLNMDFSEAPD